MDRSRSGRNDEYYESRYQESHKTRASADHSPKNRRDRSPQRHSNYHRHHSRSHHSNQRLRDSNYSPRQSQHHQAQYADCSSASSSLYNNNSVDSNSSHSRRSVKVKGDWSEHISSSGRKYYYNCKTEVSKWEKPKEWIEEESRMTRQSADLERRKDSTMYDAITPNHGNTKNGQIDGSSDSVRMSKKCNADEHFGRSNHTSAQSTPESSERPQRHTNLHELVSPDEDDSGTVMETFTQHDAGATGSAVLSQQVVHQTQVSERKTSHFSTDLESSGDTVGNYTPTKDSLHAIVSELSLLRTRSDSPSQYLRDTTIEIPVSVGLQEYKTIITSLGGSIPVISHTLQPVISTTSEEVKQSRGLKSEGCVYRKQADYIANDMLCRSCTDAVKLKSEIFCAKSILTSSKFKIECRDLRLQVLSSYAQDEPVAIESART